MYVEEEYRGRLDHSRILSKMQEIPCAANWQDKGVKLSTDGEIELSAAH